ncbi:MAG TPA: LLM class F420-dependent oxidoreductase [Candidatus Limnocylindrales bacterium]
MKLGLQIPSFTWPGGDAAIAPTLARVVRTAEDIGLDSVWVMDHLFQIRGVGPAEEPMLEGWTTLGFLAGQTSRVRLGLMVGGVHYRAPGLWVKAATTLDVLSGGRAWLGIGAGWNQEESEGLGFPFPPLAERFELLEDTLRMAHGMWQGERGSGGTLDGTHLHATRLLNSPQALSRPRVPIMVGGGGERKTLRLVARYADASNVFGGPAQIAHKYEVLREHCREVGRPFEEIERTNLQSVDPVGPGIAAGDGRAPGHGPSRPETADQIVQRFGALAEAGAQHVIFSVKGVHDLARLELLGHDVVPQLHRIDAATPA